MPDKSNKDVQRSGQEIGNKTYETSDYQAKSQASGGLATTHEQVSDVYMEGTVEATIEHSENADGDLKIPEQSYKIASDRETE
ncbi:hypothetical protein AM501_30120 [Aneurinibacillus migulanus]|nr:YozQ family protein [Aneurinibacillus migulanus]KIV53236.1 hypothetical protein TS64_19825 [Aneurinibacillus migulanus]KPD04747.1 hypothetical protein AM501_30120 [Aneurinibacillus migulanus]MCP1358693.1 YozQ family protein [Aneurinibacillus migulanus]